MPFSVTLSVHYYHDLSEKILSQDLSGTDVFPTLFSPFQNLLKKHQILEADVMAHDDRIKDLNENGNVLVEGGMFDSNSIR